MIKIYRRDMYVLVISTCRARRYHSSPFDVPLYPLEIFLPAHIDRLFFKKKKKKNNEELVKEPISEVYKS